ncbi:phosphatidylinositol 3-kinase [Babesia microti strain RI]|uniref:Phosphatidylinositol 3-kinase n=1 Tax=Babesia microti (strain RI) TaxID=1133968 RepID=A0A0K3ASB2_BABMR|nr:phosphatidylinositol 3-kinase [Babesia microti strain RI]CTQ41498.1 phosphatidylinositol 3-kinase [Babesia microti strain RI]|eukprot:XP_012649509.1 phosphatidylinositol 3-kinase [Babesia microti strain RI]
MSSSESNTARRLNISSLVLFKKDSLCLEDFKISAFQHGKRLSILDASSRTYTLSDTVNNHTHAGKDLPKVKFRNLDFLGDSSHLYSVLINSHITYYDPYKPIIIIVSSVNGDTSVPVAFGQYVPVNQNNIFLEYVNENTDTIEAMEEALEANWSCSAPICCCRGHVLCLNHVTNFKKQFGILLKRIESRNVYNRHQLIRMASKLGRFIQFANNRKICQGYHNVFGVLTERSSEYDGEAFFVDEMDTLDRYSLINCPIADLSFKQWNNNSIIRIDMNNNQPLKYLLSIPLHGIKNFDEFFTAVFDVSRRFLQESPFIKSLIFKNVKCLSNYHQALPVFLRAVDWSRESEFALHWLSCWNPPGMAQILDLLGRDFSSLPRKGSLDPSAIIRQYAVSILDKMDSLQPFISPLVLSLKLESHKGPLSTYLLKKCSNDFKLGCKFYWSLLCCKDLDDKILETFMQSCSESLYEAIKLQHAFRDNLLELVYEIKDIWSARDKNRRLNEMKSFDKLSKLILSCSNECPFPLNPDISIQGIVTKKCYVMKSHQYPIHVTCKTETGDKSFIFKHGDDLRQDQLITEMINIFEMISNDTAIDFSLSNYQVLPFSDSDGIVEFISDTTPMSSVLKLPGGIAEYLELMDKSQDQLIKLPVFKNFVNSLAAYSMITYFFNVGDRHLDNLLLHVSGNVMHIDFGYMFGADPKPFVNAHFRICSEIVSFIGGVNSLGFEMFRSACHCMFSILRKHANLIFAILYNYSFAELRNFTSTDCHNYKKKMEDMAKRLMIGEEIDIKAYVDKLIDESINSITPTIMDKVHRLALYLK